MKNLQDYNVYDSTNYIIHDDILDNIQLSKFELLDDIQKIYLLYLLVRLNKFEHKTTKLFFDFASKYQIKSVQYQKYNIIIKSFANEKIGHSINDYAKYFTSDKTDDLYKSFVDIMITNLYLGKIDSGSLFETYNVFNITNNKINKIGQSITSIHKMYNLFNIVTTTSMDNFVYFSGFVAINYPKNSFINSKYRGVIENIYLYQLESFEKIINLALFDTDINAKSGIYLNILNNTTTFSGLENEYIVSDVEFFYLNKINNEKYYIVFDKINSKKIYELNKLFNEEMLIFYNQNLSEYILYFYNTIYENEKLVLIVGNDNEYFLIDGIEHKITWNNIAGNVLSHNIPFIFVLENNKLLIIENNFAILKLTNEILNKKSPFLCRITSRDNSNISNVHRKINLLINQYTTEYSIQWKNHSYLINLTNLSIPEFNEPKCFYIYIIYCSIYSHSKAIELIYRYFYKYQYDESYYYSFLLDFFQYVGFGMPESFFYRYRLDLKYNPNHRYAYYSRINFYQKRFRSDNPVNLERKYNVDAFMVKNLTMSKILSKKISSTEKN